ncbi:MAG: acyltransferase, partial [Xanthomonadales bacterium]|nr:acyltransferase [Xanthomonadales bacterium]
EVFVDFLRAFSLIVVVIFHWTFTILEFDRDVVRANNPIGSTPGAWIVTWVLQVMPLFFFVGGYAHWIVWKK